MYEQIFTQDLLLQLSGGTTDLLHCKGPDSITCIGTSSDLYAGQAVDRLGVRLGYAFPAGTWNTSSSLPNRSAPLAAKRAAEICPCWWVV